MVRTLGAALLASILALPAMGEEAMTGTWACPTPSAAEVVWDAGATLGQRWADAEATRLGCDRLPAGFMLEVGNVHRPDGALRVGVDWRQLDATQTTPEVRWVSPFAFGVPWLRRHM
jgi:hypothetical protein